VRDLLADPQRDPVLGTELPRCLLWTDFARLLYFRMIQCNRQLFRFNRETK
jgi:hypothetical protein